MTTTASCAAQAAAQSAKQAPGHRLLLADDDRLVLATLSHALRGAGYEVLQASSGGEAWAKASTCRVDLAILDISMPGLDGMELAERLHTAQTPFMFLTAYGEQELVERAARHGALGYLVKPLDTPQILPAVTAAIARAGELEQLRETAGRMSTALAIEQRTRTAVGVLMERHRIDRQRAFEHLRNAARSQRRKIADVADELIDATERCLNGAPSRRPR